MIAIPVDSATPGVKSSKLFGNVPLFAIYNPLEEEFFVIRNRGSGDGVKTARQLKEWNVEKVVYSYMGDGPFKVLSDEGIEVFYIGKEPMALLEIVRNMETGAFVQVDADNATSYLDPGTATGSCACGCTH